MEKPLTAAFIPLRGGSKSIPFKNIKNMAGKPLAFWTIEAALQCQAIDRVFVSTDSEGIRLTIGSIENDKLEIIERSEETATDTANTESAMIEFTKQYPDYERIVLIQATSPLLMSDDLMQGIKLFQQGHHDSLLSVVQQKRFIWEEKESGARPMNYDFSKRPRRQEFDGYFVENGAFYVMSREGLLRYQNRLFGDIGLYEMQSETYVELDEPADWIVVEQLLLERKKQPLLKNLDKIKLVVFDVDGVFTDGGVYVDDLGNEQVKFSRVDGKGIELLRAQEYHLAVISAEDSEIVRKRMQKLQIPEIHLGIKDKLNCLERLCKKYSIHRGEVCFCGDDVQDIPSMQAVSISMCPGNAVQAVKEISTYSSLKNGGHGFVREVCDLLLSK